MRFTVLGTGTSHGVPMIGCECSVCTSADQRNRRMRCSAFIEVNGVHLLIDTSTELRLQALASGIKRVDAILFTHYHADHVSGLDDVKVFNAVAGGPIACYGDVDTASALQERYAYALAGTRWIGAIPHIEYNVVDDEPFSVAGVTVMPVPLEHGRIRSTGYRVGNAAYLTDCNGISERSRELLRGLDVLVLDGLRERPHPTHFCIAEAVEVIADLKPRRAYLTHLTHEVDHATLNAQLPHGVELAYDGLTLEL
ncbi:MAG: MBL fold metallo-hydrolase [Chloroflexota bacterium]